MTKNKQFLNRNSLFRFFDFHPAPMVAFSFMGVIITGAILLKLPAATEGGYISFIDALFTATSAVCVTGLVVVDTGTFFSQFGQWVILVLIQIGGLGVMTVSVMLFRAIGRSITFRQRMALQDIFAHTPREDILQVVKTIILFTIMAETAGFLLFFLHWSHEFPPGKAAYFALFHSVSAFCNAGFALLPDSMVAYRGDLLVNFTLCVLITLGGIGFPVVFDLYMRVRDRRRRRTRLTMQTKTVLVTTAILIVGGAVMYWILEQGSTLAGTSLSESILVSLLQSVTCRTAGFNSADIGSLSAATLTMMIGLMFVGASPGSCGGGVKTTTLALISAFTWSRIRRRRRVNIFKKTVPPETVSRSLSLTLVSSALIGIALFLVLAGADVTGDVKIAESGNFLAVLFETVSAFGTVGLSMGITPLLTSWGKILIILLMLIGRVGVLTFSYIIIGGGMANGIEHSEENIMIG
jgi:trk system potassium uptake protein TrkH